MLLVVAETAEEQQLQRCNAQATTAREIRAAVAERRRRFIVAAVLYLSLL